MIIGFTAGVFADVPLATKFNLQPALNFVQGGYEVEDDIESGKVDFNYLEVALNCVYNTKGFFRSRAIYICRHFRQGKVC